MDEFVIAVLLAVTLLCSSVGGSHPCAASEYAPWKLLSGELPPHIFQIVPQIGLMASIAICDAKTLS